jgi:hypothetical protein
VLLPRKRVTRLIRPVRPWCLTVAAQVDAGTESAPGSSEDHRPAGTVAAQLDHCFMERLAEFGVHRVQRVWTIQRQGANMPTPALNLQNIGHGDPPSVLLRI